MRDSEVNGKPVQCSYEDLCRSFGPPSGHLVRVLMRMGCEREDARDIAQESLVRLLGRFDRVPNPQAWATKTATNLFIDRSRHLGMRARGLPKLFPLHRGNVGDHATAVADQTALAVCIRELKPIQRAIITLRYYEDYKLREIAEVLGKSENTIKYLGIQAERELCRRLTESP